MDTTPECVSNEISHKTHRFESVIIVRVADSVCNSGGTVECMLHPVFWDGAFLFLLQMHIEGQNFYPNKKGVE